MKQVAFNQRIIAAEEEIAGINCDVADFVSGMSLDPTEEVIICVNGSEEMKRGESAMAGQLWIQGDRKMSASNPPLPGMANTKEAAVLSAVADAVSWRNEAIEPEDPPRRGKRVVVYPRELSHLDSVISSGDLSVDDEHVVAYQSILKHAQQFEVPPLFIKEDADLITADPVLSEKVPSWMCIAERIATGSRKRVNEDGPDTWHSDDEAQTDVEADKEANMYTPEMDPLKGPQRLTLHQAALLRAAAAIASRTSSRASSAAPSASSTDVDSDFGNSIISTPVSSRQPTPLNSDDDDGNISYDQQRAVNLGKKMAQRGVPRSPSAPGTHQAKSGAPGTRSRAVPVPPMPDPAERARKARQDERDFLEMLDDPRPVVPPSSSYTAEPKAAASQRAPADQPSGAKAPPPNQGQGSGQESPVAKATHPMQTRQRSASGAGSLRGVDGLGKTDVARASKGPHSKT
jgi:hypothetical protein